MVGPKDMENRWTFVMVLMYAHVDPYVQRQYGPTIHGTDFNSHANFIVFPAVYQYGFTDGGFTGRGAACLDVRVELSMSAVWAARKGRLQAAGYQRLEC